jgi:hypothetical protein
MKNRVLVACILILPLGLFIYFLAHPVAETKSAGAKTASAQDAAVARALAVADPRTTAIIASNFAAPPQTPYYAAAARQPSVKPAGLPKPLEFTTLEPVTVLQNMSRAVRQYGEMFGGNPVGTNPEITSQLTGRNPKHINFISAEAGLRINGNGELVDPWGTPYFFHQISGHEMEIHSAGPDRIMWTADDMVTE